SRQEFINTYQIQPLVYIPELPYSAKTTFVIMYVVIFLLALAGNSLVIYIVVKKRAIQTATDIFICSLAVSDLLITFFCIPFTLLQNVSSQWFGGVLVCKAVPFVQTTAIVTGILTMTCIAVERYQGIVFPLKMRRQYSSKRAYNMLGLVWTASVIVGSPMLFVQQLEVSGATQTHLSPPFINFAICIGDHKGNIMGSKSL
uniref:Pyroglutamylated RFamide peptide receptor n=1 Tax=Gasterosteus aculeatus TaxID=69293 RepID=G3NCG7_GASAC